MAENAVNDRINFYKPKNRFIIPIDSFHTPRKLYNDFKKTEFTFNINSNFSEVINLCSNPRKNNPETWINQTIKNTYNKLFDLNIAKSIECFDQKKLIGGLYGIHIGGCFFGESMFSKITNASKFCLLALITILKENNFSLLDSQFYNEHLTQFGAYEIPDFKYQLILEKEISKKCTFPEKFDFQRSLLTLQSLSHKS